MNFQARKIEILIIFLIGIIPILWYKPGYIIARGDSPPYTFTSKSAANDFYLWSANNLGNPSPFPAYSLYGLLWTLSHFLLLNTGLWQIILLITFFVSASLSMLYLVKTAYPEEKTMGIVAAIFYVFNFSIFSNQILLNIGMMWTYALLPLLIALFMKILTQKQSGYKHALYFSLTFTIVASIASINLADVALIFISLASVLLYYVIFERKIMARSTIKNMIILLIMTLLLSLWWVIPIVNYYVLSPSAQLQREVNVVLWSWTHARASFLNLFQLNGGWGWRPEYFPYYYFYTGNAILEFSLFAPFLIAATSILIKGEKRKFNAYFMLTSLLFIFLAKGLHEPFSSVNLFLYNYIPYMNMFREPISKFTLIMIPFLALLIGYSTDKIAKTLRRDIGSKLFIIVVILVFIVSSFPMITNPIEFRTEQIPYSTYVKMPQYWYETSEWLNNRTGDFKILITPLDDYYQVPYTWGYYGTDTFVERLIQKPIISACYIYSYKVNPNIVTLINQLRDAIKYNRTEEFETVISLLNVKYILQRNDLDYEYMDSTNRDIAHPKEMRTFLSSQPDLILVKTIGKLDIYEYVKAQSYIKVLDYRQAQEYIIQITNKTILSLQWAFNSTDQLNEWKNTTLENQFGATCKLYLDDGALKFELWNSTWGWKIIASPFVRILYGAKYSIRFDIKGQNASGVHIKILEYSQKKEITYVEYVGNVADGSFDWKSVQIDYTIKMANTTFVQLLIWNGHETDKPFPNTIWIDNVEMQGYATELNTAEIQEAVETSTLNRPARIIEYTRLDPTKIIVRLNASKPFLLAMNEVYDPSWKAYLEEETLNSVPVFSVMNGFLINKTGQLEILIEYEPQRLFYIGCSISLATLFICVTYVTYVNTRGKRIKQKKIMAKNT